MRTFTKSQSRLLPRMATAPLLALFVALSSPANANLCRGMENNYWSGFYVGGHIGAAFGELESDDDDVDVVADELDPSGFAGGVGGGLSCELERQQRLPSIDSRASWRGGE